MPSKGVSRSKLLQLYDKALNLSGFIEEGQQDFALIPWSRQIEPGVCDLRVAHGFYNGKPAIMQVGVNEILSESSEYLQKQYSLSGPGGGIYIPKVLFSVKCEDPEPYFCLIQEKFQNQGAPFLPRFPFSSSSQKKVIADLYWKTMESFSEMCQRDEKMAVTMAKNEGQFSSLYFGRLNRWLATGEDAWRKVTGTKGQKQREKEQYLQDRKMIEEIIRSLKSSHIVEESALSPQLFFKHFGYTDMVYDGDTGQFGLPMADMGIYPQYYGATYWVWNMLMHGHGQSPSWAAQEVNKWFMAFVYSAPRSEGAFPSSFSWGFHVNLLERVVASLLVDIPLERSPFDKESNTRKEKGRNIFRKTLMERYKN